MKVTYSIDELQNVAAGLVRDSRFKTWLFDAPMGAGKTTLIKAIAREFGVREMASSPTFSIVNEYRTDDDCRFFHFDLYRLKNEEEAYDMGLDEYFDLDAWCMVEWPDQAPGVLPDSVHRITINILDESTRELKFE